MLLIFVILCSNFMFVSAEPSSSVIDIGNELIPIPLQPLRLVVQPEYQCNGDLITNVTYTAYASASISDGSKIDFYTGNPNNPYPTTLLGSSYVKDGKAVFKTYQKIDNYYLGSAVWTRPLGITPDLPSKYPPSRVYSNIVTYHVALSDKVIDLNVSVKNLSIVNNVSYTAKFGDPADAKTLADTLINPADIKINGIQMKARFLTYQIPTALDVKTLDRTTIDKIAIEKPYREDYAIIKDWAASVSLNLPVGRYIVFADCIELTANSDVKSYSVSKVIIISTLPPITPEIMPTPRVIVTPPVKITPPVEVTRPVVSEPIDIIRPGEILQSKIVKNF